MFDFDLLVIGAGSGGVRAARLAAAKGVKVAIVEEKYFGGTCVNVGCVPKKLLVYASEFSENIQQAKGFGWQFAEGAHDWSTLIANKDKEIARLNGIYRQLLTNAGVEIIHGRAVFKDAHTVQVGEHNYRAEKILITVGGKPSTPGFIGSEYIFNSNEAFYLPARPQRVLIIGAGFIALEFAGIFNGLGSDVTVLARSQVLRGFDQSVAAFTRDEIRKKGITILEHTQIDRISKQNDGLHCVLTTGDSIVVDKVMWAAGRVPLTQHLGLQHTAVQCRDNGSIVVNERFQTAQPSIFALGDVIGTPELTPVALAQAMVFVDQQFGENKRQMSYEAIPSTVFCQPSLATVGLTEQEALAQNIACDVYVSEFRALKHTLSGSNERSMIKMLVAQADQKVLGVHIAGHEAGEILQGFAVAVKAGLSKQQVDATIGIHPTVAEELVTMREYSYQI